MMTKYQLEHPRDPNAKMDTRYFIYHENYGISAPFSKFDIVSITMGIVLFIAMIYLHKDEIFSAPAEMNAEQIKSQRALEIFNDDKLLDKYVKKWEKRCYDSLPVAMWWTIGGMEADSIQKCNNTCRIIRRKPLKDIGKKVSVFLFYGSSVDIHDMPPSRKESDIWILFHEESPKNLALMFNDDFIKLFNYSATFSRYSDVPFPLGHMTTVENLTSLQYFVKTEDKNKLLDDIAPIIYIQSSCGCQTQRDQYVRELMKYIRVDSYGACVQNKILPDELKTNYLKIFRGPEFLKFTARYKFTIAIENGVCNDYVSEKLWRPINVGSVPIYLGSPTIRDWLPNNKSAILLTDYPSPLLMATYLKSLLANDTLYEEHLEHKTKGLISNPYLLEEYQKHPYSYDFAQTVVAFETFVCNLMKKGASTGLAPRTIDRSHYDCPMPISALTLQVDTDNYWVTYIQLVKQLHKHQLNVTMVM